EADAPEVEQHMVAKISGVAAQHRWLVPLPGPAEDHGRIRSRALKPRLRRLAQRPPGRWCQPAAVLRAERVRAPRFGRRLRRERPPDLLAAARVVDPRTV